MIKKSINALDYVTNQSYDLEYASNIDNATDNYLTPKELYERDWQEYEAEIERINSGKIYNDHLICKTRLLKRGWTESMIRECGLLPDKEVINPNCSSSFIKLYDRDKIEIIESSKWYKTRYELFQKRREASLRGLRTRAINKHNNSIKVIKSLIIELPDWSREDAIREALKNYDNSWVSRENMSEGDYTLERIVSYYFRHCYFGREYSKLLFQLFKCEGVGYANYILQERINAAVHQKYFTAEAKANRKNNSIK